MTEPHDDAINKEKVMAAIVVTATTLTVEVNGTPSVPCGIIGAKRCATAVFLRRPGRAA